MLSFEYILFKNKKFPNWEKKDEEKKIKKNYCVNFLRVIFYVILTLNFGVSRSQKFVSVLSTIFAGNFNI